MKREIRYTGNSSEDETSDYNDDYTTRRAPNPRKLSKSRKAPGKKWNLKEQRSSQIGHSVNDGDISRNSLSLSNCIIIDSDNDGGKKIIRSPTRNSLDKENTVGSAKGAVFEEENPMLTTESQGSESITVKLPVYRGASTKRWLLHVGVPISPDKVAKKTSRGVSRGFANNFTLRNLADTIAGSACCVTDIDSDKSPKSTMKKIQRPRGSKALSSGEQHIPEPKRRARGQTSMTSFLNVPPQSSKTSETSEIPGRVSSHKKIQSDDDDYEPNNVEEESGDTDLPEEDDGIMERGCASDEQSESATNIYSRKPTKKAVPKGLKGGSGVKSSAADPSVHATTAAHVKWKSGIDEGLPPLHEISSIFADITTKALGLGFPKVIEHLASRKLKVATMCSGTESPLLALGLICNALKTHHDIDLQVDHKFSAEIVPFKQAYIERNFHPKIIFRDIRELALQKKASTAYGAPMDVPGDADILVAGFSCVDFSYLNAWRKNLDDVGESGDTFRAILNYARKYRPPLIVLENVCSAPWREIESAWRKFGYAAKHIRLDTKQYYIPHTRQRGYMICIDKEKLQGADAAVAKWETLMGSFERQASSPVDAFLLKEDDTRLQRAREELIRDSRGQDKSAREVDWTTCMGRHITTREENKLGFSHAITRWVIGGYSEFFDYGWLEWSRHQVDRIKDTIDIHTLRNVQRGFDSSFKTRVWELSQNCDRFTDTTPAGITGCVTPTGQPFLTTRGGPIIGLESVALQGLPIDNLLLTRETQKELQDLAGNAMTSTVVGAAIASALIVGYKALQKGPGLDLAEVRPDEQVPLQPHLTSHLKTVPIKFEPLSHLETSKLYDMAQASLRLCYCEGQTQRTQRRLQICKECSHTVCDKCGGVPRHHYVDLGEQYVKRRLQPQDFVGELKKSLPMRLFVNGLHLQKLEIAKTECEQRVDQKTWGTYVNAVGPALGSELRFHSIKRNHSWTVYYESPYSRLELVFTKRKPQWFFYVKVDPQECGSSTIRRILENPIARMTVTGQNILEGRWEISIPVTFTVPLTIEGIGALLPAWEKRLGLQDSLSANKSVWSTLRIGIESHEPSGVDLDIAGEYKYLPDCGTASGSLHKRISVDSDECDDLFFFLDPHRIEDPKRDSFVFSMNINRLTYGEKRQIAGRVSQGLVLGHGSSTWRPSNTTKIQKVQCEVFGRWLSSDLKLESFMSRSVATYSVPEQDVAVHVSKGSKAPDDQEESTESLCPCRTAMITVLSCSVPLSKDEHSGWHSGAWVEIDQINEQAMFASFAWLTERTRHLEGFSSDWRQMRLPEEFVQCQVCAPNPPEIKWQRSGSESKIKAFPFEDPRQAGTYERAIKSRPTPFSTRIRIDEALTGRMLIGLNVPTLAHRALAKLSNLDNLTDVDLLWRLDTQYSWPSSITLPRFTLQHNRNDPRLDHVFYGKDEDGSRLHLLDRQQHSFKWMIGQEDKDAQPFFEEEIEEACLPYLGWRAEVCAKRACRIYGGVLADQVGYGKTITTLALIDHQMHIAVANAAKVRKGAISSKATLIIGTNVLVQQWAREIKRFLGNSVRLLVMETPAKLARYTISDVQEADIILTTCSIFGTSSYLSRFASFAALSEAPSSAGRAFDAWLAEGSRRIEEHVEELASSAFNKKFWTILNERLAAAENDTLLEEYIPSKRRKGKAYVASRLPKELEDEGVESAEFTDENKKRKRITKAPKKKASTVDIFGFHTASTLGSVQVPVLNLFHFDRVVVDEFTYLKNKEYSYVKTLKATNRWVLSGTPPLEDFADVKGIAGLLRIDLGVDDDARGVLNKHNIRHIRKERTAAEQFEAFTRTQSPAWHQHRQGHAQRFLNQFARQNAAENDEIPIDDTIRTVNLAAAERAIYMELQQQLCSQDMKLKSGTKINKDNDRSNRLKDLLDECESPGEALLKRCSQFQFNSTGSHNATGACNTIVSLRKEQLDSLLRSLKTKLVCAAKWKLICGDSDLHYIKWKNHLESGVLGDADARSVVKGLVHQAESSIAVKKDVLKNKNEETIKEAVKELRSLTERIRVDSVELVARTRALRFFEHVRNIQFWQSQSRDASASTAVPVCDRCSSDLHEPSEVSVFGLCGHTTCNACLASSNRGTECLATGCDAAAFDYHIVKATELGKDDGVMRVGQYYGTKIQQLVALIRDQIPKEDQVLVFAQFNDLMLTLSAAFDEYNISHAAITADVESHGDTAGKIIKDFQENQMKTRNKVLLLNPTSSSAAGLNLVNANHVIYVSPLLSGNSYLYNASMTQSIGRARRPGQKKTVFVYRFLSLKTIDVDIIQDRTGKKLIHVASKGTFDLKYDNQLSEAERQQSWGSGYVKTLFSIDSEDDEEEE